MGLPDYKANLIDELIFILNTVNTDDIFIVFKLTGCTKIISGKRLDLCTLSVISVKEIELINCVVFLVRPIDPLDREFKITSLHVFLFYT